MGNVSRVVRRYLHGHDFVLPGDLVAIRGYDAGKWCWTPNVKGRYLGLATDIRAGDPAHATVRITGQSTQFIKGETRSLPITVIRPRDNTGPATFPTGSGHRLLLHYGQAVVYRGGWFRVTGSGLTTFTLSNCYGPREGVRVGYGEPFTYLTETDIRSRLAILADPGSPDVIRCGRCDAPTVRWDLVTVDLGEDRTGRHCPACVAESIWRAAGASATS